MDGELEQAREALVQKIGENISVRRVELLTADAGIIGACAPGMSSSGATTSEYRRPLK